MSYNGYDFSSIANFVNHVGFSKFVLDLKGNIYMHSGFNQIREKVYVEDTYMFQIRLYETDILDIINTVCVIMSTETYCNFYKWFIRRDNMGYSLTLPIEDFRRIQKGFTAEMLLLKNQHKISISRNCPKFPWVLRCLNDVDDLIFSKGIRCLYYKLTSHLHETQNSFLTIKRWKTLDKLLDHMSNWRNKLVDLDSGFMEGLITFLTPSNMKQSIFVNKNACEIMNKRFGCPFECPKTSERFHFKLKNPSLMNIYYKWLMSKSPNDALTTFCGVHNQIKYKSTKKRKKNQEEPSIENEEVLTYYKNKCSQGEKEQILPREKKLKENILDIVYFSFYISDCKNWNNLKKNQMYSVMKKIIELGVAGKFTPIASLTRKINETKCLRQNDLFPIIHLPKELKLRIEKDKIPINFQQMFC